MSKTNQCLFTIKEIKNWLDSKYQITNGEVEDIYLEWLILQCTPEDIVGSQPKKESKL